MKLSKRSLNKTNVIAIVSGPMGSGKTTLINKLRNKFPHIVFLEFDQLGYQAAREIYGHDVDPQSETWSFDEIGQKRADLLKEFLLDNEDDTVVIEGVPSDFDKINCETKLMLDTSAEESTNRAIKRQFGMTHKQTEKHLSTNNQIVRYLKRIGFEKLSANQLEKKLTKILETIPQPVISYVPTIAVNSVLTNGLMSAKELLKYPDLLKLAALARDRDPDEYKHGLIKRINDPKTKLSLAGPSALLKNPPNHIKLAQNHPMNKMRLTPVEINLSALLRDHPDIKIFGQELIPFSEDVDWSKREHYLSMKELAVLQSKTADELWELYSDPDNVGYYAKDVPHISIHMPVIKPKYLRKLDMSF